MRISFRVLSSNMAKSKPSRNKDGARSKNGSDGPLRKVLPGRTVSKKTKKPAESVEGLLAEASALLQTSQLEEARSLVLRALAILDGAKDKFTTGIVDEALQARSLLGEICIELGEPEEARANFLAAAELDRDGFVPESQGGGPEKFLWLAQLSEEGGNDSLQWFEKGITALRSGIASTPDMAEQMQKRKKLASALCGVVEIYMTDLSWESDAESRCESLITEAMLVAPECPEALQTLANVRISQTRMDEARKALTQSIEIWKDLPAGDESVPNFPARISLARLLMEVGMEDDALEVLERLVDEDDTSVEAWYLGGWCQYLATEKSKIASNSVITDAANNNSEESDSKAALVSSRDWLRNSLHLYDLQDYEDERLKEHALELVQGLDADLGDAIEEEEEGGAENDDWESEVDTEDQVMNGT
ncbi:MAG: hypothetical protein Q9212_006389 [Teloschistes hypoglaucus]